MGRITTLVCVFLALAAVARADDDPAGARAHFEKGTKAFDLGAYDEAIAEYSAAYRLMDDPALLYNIAQAHRLANHAPEALRFYKMYLVRAPQATNRAEVEAKIAELEKLLAQQQKTQTMPPDMVKPPTGAQPAQAPPPAANIAAAPPPAAPNPSTPAPDEGSRAAPARTKKIAGLAVGGVGVAALVTGIALSAVAKTYADELSSSTGVWDKSKHQTGETLGVAGPVLIAVGGAATVAGAVVAALGFREARIARSASVAVIPEAGPQGARASVRIRF